ncbi:acyltransferase family protein [Actinospongicola halichondriae]|uniref:acyltransferase family protein n=1 Tax=Actinospongicola halichondriae TaxID=3236844 RepID=UPI003D3A4250
MTNRSTAADLAPIERARTRTTASGLPYLPGLDGLRAVSVVAVVLYHLDNDHAIGGYLGVEVFFVVSGYLITSLLLTERDQRGHVDLGRFWLRRARRLLPAAIALITTVCLHGLVFARDDVAGFRGDALASIFYVQNWWAVVSDQSYFAGFGRPSPLRHLWSLAIEEQFYLFWPVVVAVVLHRFGGRRTLLVATSVAVVVSLVLMRSLADVTDLDRAYYGTDTRAFGLLAGAALAMVWRPGPSLADRAIRVPVVALDVAAALAVGALVWQFEFRSEFDSFTFPWGFAWVDALTLVAIVSVSTAGTVSGRILGASPLVALGRRSYSIYLWHWPVFVFLRPGEELPFGGVVADLLRIAVALVLAELSYRLVEQPFRDGRARAALRRVVARLMAADRLGAGVGGAFGAVVLLVGAVALQNGSPGDDLEAQFRDAVEAQGVDADDVIADENALPSTTAVPTTGTGPIGPPAPAVPTEATTTTSTTTTVPIPTSLPDGTPTGGPVTIIGESVTLGARAELLRRLPVSTVNAEISREFVKSVDVAELLEAGDLLQPTVLVHIGNNGVVPDGQLDRLLAIVGGRRLIVTTVSVPRRWEQQVNSSLLNFANAHDNVELLDWQAVVAAEDGLLFDGVHLTKPGIQRYAAFLVEAIGPP